MLKKLRLRQKNCFLIKKRIFIYTYLRNRILMALIFLKKTFRYTMYADDSTFFLKDEKSVIELMKTFDIFSTFSGLRTNKSKCEKADLRAPKGAKLALCGMECIDLMINAIKILGVYYSHDKNLENQENFINLILKIEKL